jgi:cytochrome c oxidase cbb3-type subunit III
MSDQTHNSAPMQGHDYDGITELDNKLPRWWVWLFWITIIYGAVYLGYYHVARVGPLQEAAYQREMKAAKAAIAAHEIASTIGSGTNTNGTPSIYQATAGAAEPAAPAADPADALTDTATLEKGKGVYMANCLPCHGDKGQGIVGPNFTDDWYIHGPLFADTLRTIREGVIAKGMVPWKGVLKPADVIAVASYIHSLRGTNPPNPKPPEPEAKQHPAKA